LASHRSQKGRCVFDLGCGEGKNAAPLATAGAEVTAIDCSEYAIANARLAWPDLAITWICDDVQSYVQNVADATADLIIMYGLLHCLSTPDQVIALVERAKVITKPGGYHLIVAFNDGPHDLTAHPNFTPVLLSHQNYVDLYRDWQVVEASDEILYETHPHNNISHFHSLTRMIARKP